MELKTPRGMRDFLPEEMIFREKAFEIIRTTFESFGFQPLETPIIENLDVLTLKSGDAVKNEIYNFKDKGDRDVGLRFDLTVPLARVFASNPQLPRPFKRYCISRVYRYEEPQAKRYREFWQADVDIVGSAEPLADATCVAAAVESLKRLGFSKFSVKLNSRKIINAAVRMAGIAEAKTTEVTRAIDKLEKIGKNGVTAELEKTGLSKSQISKLFSFIEITGKPAEVIERAELLVGAFPEGKEGCDELKKFLSAAESYGFMNFCEVELRIARGLDYYTGLVFEIVPEGGGASLGGGGRYDNLIELFGGGKVPAVGFSLGVERIIDMMDRKGSPKNKTDAFFIPVGTTVSTSLELATKLRAKGVSCDIEMSGRKLGKALEYASKLGIPWAVIVGEKDMLKGQITLRNLDSGKEKQVPVDSLENEF